jgi:malate synthase
MLVDLTTLTKRTPINSDVDKMPRPQTKKKETGADDRNHARLGLEEEVSHSMRDCYDVTSQDWNNLSRALKKTIRTAKSKKNYGKTYAYRKKSNKIEQYSPEQPTQIEQAQKFTEWPKNGNGH